MAYDGVSATLIDQHFCCDFSGIGARRMGGEILPPDLDVQAAHRIDDLLQIDKRWAEYNVYFSR